MRKQYEQYFIQTAKALLIVLISCFAFDAAGQSFTINSVSTPDNTFYYPYEEIDVTYASDYSWPSGTTFYLVLDVDGDGEYSEGDHLLDSESSASGTLTGTLPNDPDIYNLLVVAGNDGDPGSDGGLSDTQVNSFTLTRTGTDEFVYPLSFDLLNTDRSITSASDDYDDGAEYTIFVSLDADSVTSSNPIMLEYIIGDDTTIMSDVEGNSEFTASTDTLVFALPAGALMADVRFRLSQQGSDTIAADTLEWAVNDLRIQSNDNSLIRYGVVDNGAFTTTAPTITLGGDSLSVYVGEDIGVAYEGFGYTTGATFYLYSGDLTDPDNRIIYGSSTDLEDSITGTWRYVEDDLDLSVSGYYGNIDTPELDLGADTLTVLGTDESDYSLTFDQAGVRSAVTPSLDITGENYATLQIGLDSDGSLSATNSLVVAYNTGSGWVSIDSISGDFNMEYEFEITSAMLSSATQFRVRQANTANGAGVNAWDIDNFDVKLHELQSTTAVGNPGNYPLFYSIDVEDIMEVTSDDDTVSITEAYPGDTILVHASVAGFDADADSINFAVVIDGTYLLEDLEVNVDADADSVLLSGILPANIEYTTGLNVLVKLYSGSNPVVGLDVDVFEDYDADDDDSEISFMGGEYDSGSKDVTFLAAGDRWLTTPAINIPTNEGLTLEFTLDRESGARSPAGTEIVLEYSKDGTSFTSLGTYSLNAGGGGDDYLLEDDVLTSDVVGSAVYFRFRQLSNNGQDLDGWTISDIEFTNGTTLLSYDYLNYSFDVLDILEPVITLEAFDDSEEYYPGEDLEVVFSIEGVFPEGTNYELVVDNEVPLVFGEFTAAGTYTVTVPALVAGVYSNIKIVADHEDVESAPVSLTVNAVQITDINITSSESTTDGDYEFIYPGNEITVSYNTVGEIGDGVMAYLEVYDGNENEYVILEDSLTVGDDITTTLPTGLDYTVNGPEDGDPGPDFRLSLKDMSGTLTFTSYSDDWGGDDTESDNYFPLSDRVAHQGGNFFYNNSGTAGERSATSIFLDLTGGGEVDFDINLVDVPTWYDGDQEIYLQYSTDKGDTWEELETGIITDNTDDIFQDRIVIPDGARTDSVKLRFIYNEDGSRTYADNYVQFTGFDIYYYESSPIAEEEFDLEDVSDLSLEYLSLSLATLEDTEFNLGEEFTVSYNADGPFGDVDFAVVMEETGSGDYMVLEESDQTGAVELTVSAPEIPFGNASPNYQISVYPFKKVSETDTYRAAAETENLTAEEDFISVSGSDETTPTFDFDLDGARSLTTRAVNLGNFEFATLNFTAVVHGTITTVSTLPVLEASTDGTTFEVIPVTDATYEEQGYVYPGMTYNVEIPEEYLVEEVWFRWRQPLNGGDGIHTWEISAVSLSKGESNVFSPDAYEPYGMDQSVSLNEPDLDDFDWAKADSLVAVFNGDDFDFTWGIDSTDIEETTFPDNTEFIFTLNGVTDPETGEQLVLASGSSYGTYSGTIPFYVENGQYDIDLTAYITYTNEDGEEEEYYFFEEDQIPSANLDIFNRVFRTVSPEADSLGTIYAGSTLNFSYETENEQEAGTFDDLYSNLVVSFMGDEWLLASEQGVTDISVDLLPFMWGTLPFEIRLSEDGPIGDVGDKLENSDELSDLQDDDDNFTSGDLVGSDVEFISSSGRRLITTRDFTGEELTNTEIFRYEATFDQESEDITVSQHVVFEYSMDEGVSYMQLDTFPNPGAAGLVDDYYTYEITDDMKAASTVRFRWRQEESKGNFVLDNMSFDYAEELPFDYISESISISRQALSVTSIEQDEICAGDTITLEYDIRGKFGDDLILTVHYADDETSTDDDLDAEFEAVSEGTGTVSFVLPSEVLDEDYDNGSFTFYVGIKDVTYDKADDPYGASYSVNSQYSDERLEVVQVINESITFNNMSKNACDLDEVIFLLGANLQEGFLYEVRNVEDQTVLGSLTYDSEVGITEINIGTITETTDFELVVTSMSSSGLTCNTKVVQDATVTINENYELSLDYENYDPVIVGVNDSIVVCEGSYPDLRLSIVNPEGNRLHADESQIEWFRDSFDNPLDNSDFDEVFGNTSYYSYTADNDYEQLVAGEYFARITINSCVYLTERFKVVNIELPEVPEITVVSGDLEFCDGDGEVELMAPEGYNFYEWNDGSGVVGSNENTLIVDEAGSYTVSVGNTSECLAQSEAVEISSSSKVEFTLYSDSDGLSNYIQGGEMITVCESTTIQIDEDDQTNFNSNPGGVFIVYQDGNPYQVVQGTTTNPSISIDESGTYHVEWMADEFASTSTCVTTSSEFTVEILDQVNEKPTITGDGPLSFCEGGSVTLRANTVGDYEYYRWYDGSNYMNVNADSVVVDVDGTYSVQVSNIPFTNGSGCFSAWSNSKTVAVYEEQNIEINHDVNTAEVDSDLSQGEIIQVCSSVNNYLDVDNASGTVYYTWFLDGTAINTAGSGNDRLLITQSGVYHAEVTQTFGGANANGCVTSTNEVTVEFYDEPAAVTIADPGAATFCADEVDVTLTADAGAAFYLWYRNGFSIGDPITSNELHVTQEGEYQVRAIAFDNGCYSDFSNVITIESVPLPTTTSTFNTISSEADCGAGVLVTFAGTSPEFAYQLIDFNTGELIGNPVTGASSDIEVSYPDIAESTPVYVEVSYADGTGGCTAETTGSVTLIPNNAMLELKGATLSVVTSGTVLTIGGTTQIRWYRNDVEMVNREGFTSITVIDAATYRVEVDYAGGCTITSNAIDLSAGGRVAPPTSAQGIVASTYPNPTTDVVNLDIPGDKLGTVKVQIMTLSGQILISESFEKNAEQFIKEISISKLDAGIYNMTVVQGNEVENIRIVKQ